MKILDIDKSGIFAIKPGLKNVRRTHHNSKKNISNIWPKSVVYNYSLKPLIRQKHLHRQKSLLENLLLN